jgi:transposase
MTKPYSLDLRERVVFAVEHEGMSRHRAAARFDVAVSSAIRWVARFRKTGSAAPFKIGGYKPKTLRGEHAAWLIARSEKDFTIRQLVQELGDIRGLKVDRRPVWEFLHGHGLSRKKTARATEQDRPDVKRRREQWRKYQGRIDPNRLVFIDET